MKIEIDKSGAVTIETDDHGAFCGPLVVALSGEHETSDKTFGEIWGALAAGRGAVFSIVDKDERGVSFYVANAVYADDDGWHACFDSPIPGNGKRSLNTNAELSDYPYFFGGLK